MSIIPSAGLVFLGMLMTGRMVQLVFTPLDHAVSNLAQQAMYGVALVLALRTMAQLFINHVHAAATVESLGADAQLRASREERRREHVQFQAGTFRSSVGATLELVSYAVGRMTSAADQLVGGLSLGIYSGLSFVLIGRS